MKRIISVFMSVVLFALASMSCGTLYESPEPSMAVEEVEYTIEDLNNLQNFILANETTDLSNKNYDLDNDGRWDVFDFCLMKSKISPDIPENDSYLKGEFTMNITVGDTTLTAEMCDNSSAKALKEMLESAPLTIDMKDYSNFEKVGSLGKSLPRNDERITTEAGDIILYQGNQITIYYDENTWNFTRLGKINNATKESLLEILGDGDVTVTLSLPDNK